MADFHLLSEIDKAELAELQSIESHRSRELSTRAIAGRVTYHFIDGAKEFVELAKAKQATAYVACLLSAQRG